MGKPKLLFEITVERRPQRRRFRLALIILIASVGALYAITEAKRRGLADDNLLDIGWLAAVLVIALAGIRAVLSLVRQRRRRDEQIRFFNQGLTWERNGEKRRYNWHKLRTFREGGRGIYMGKRPLLQWGAITLTMADNQVYKLYPWHGDLRQYAKLLRPYAAEYTGIHMGRRLRQEKPVRLHRRLIVWPGGLQIGKKELPWRALNVNVKGNRLIIRAKENGRVRTVGRFSTHSVDNLGGFVELATTTIRTHRA